MGILFISTRHGDDAVRMLISHNATHCHSPLCSLLASHLLSSFSASSGLMASDLHPSRVKKWEMRQRAGDCLKMCLH